MSPEGNVCLCVSVIECCGCPVMDHWPVPVLIPASCIMSAEFRVVGQEGGVLLSSVGRFFWALCLHFSIRVVILGFQRILLGDLSVDQGRRHGLPFKFRNCPGFCAPHLLPFPI